ncbi:hypothetical protein EIP86_006461 [Pleurotus ostreatoroseus]|nr:hypothetical protein EIP86_006461 [Pleurotus ostreatoroseus]
MLFDEDDDYDLADPPGMHRLSERYTDDPRTPSMHSRASSRTQGVPPFPVASIPGSSSPHLLGLRASESGSIFREAVWPPPGDQSRLVDPLVAGSNAVDLGRIVGDVMGPNSPNMQPGQRASQSSLQPSVAIATGVGSGAHSRQSSATRLLSSHNPTSSDPPAYNDADRRDYEAELARAQSPDSVRYTTREGPLRVANAGPDSPSSVTFNNTPPGTPKVRNWLERSPKTVAKETDDPSRPADDDHVVMGEAL